MGAPRQLPCVRRLPSTAEEKEVVRLYQRALRQTQGSARLSLALHSSRRLHLAKQTAGSFFGGFRTPAPSACPSSHTAGIRNPAQNENPPLWRLCQLPPAADINPADRACLALAIGPQPRSRFLNQRVMENLTVYCGRFGEGTAAIEPNLHRTATIEWRPKPAVEQRHVPIEVDLSSRN
jgi:hypothetical protein